MNCSFIGENAAQNALEQQRQAAVLPGPSNLHVRENGLEQQRHGAALLGPSNLHADFTIRRNEPLFQPERRPLNNVPKMKFNIPTAQIRMFYDGQSNGKL